MADKQDIQENEMSGGTPARLRGLDANGNSISPTLEEVMNAMGMVLFLSQPVPTQRCRHNGTHWDNNVRP